MREDMYLFQKQGKDYKVVDKEWKAVRDQLVNMRVNGGFLYITVNDGDYLRNGELYLKHWYEGIELDVKYLEKVLPYVYQLWGRLAEEGLWILSLELILLKNKIEVFNGYFI